jgi:hypothetical protein
LYIKIIEICIEKHIQISTVQNSPRSKQPRSPLPSECIEPGQNSFIIAFSCQSPLLSFLSLSK